MPLFTIKMELSVVFYAILGGVLPALLWLWFWNKEDKKNPEPLRLIIAAFLIGMVAVVASIPLEKLAVSILAGTAVVIAWAAIEEIVKFVLAYVTVLRHKANNEPVDPLIYTITVALGFAALENTLFLINPIATSGAMESILTGNFRFLGATLLHVLSSAMVGLMLGLAFYKPRHIKILYGIFGLILAVVLHGSFNFFILNTQSSQLLRVFACVWAGLILLLILFEHIKRIKKS